MSELLIIRLASEPHQPNHWLIWSNNEKEIIGSGEVENAQALQQLTEKAQTRRVICLVPGVDVTLKSVPINGAFTRQMQQALPYMLEDELASDVDKLHFCVIAKEINLVHVAICFKSKLQHWLSCLDDAKISCKQFIPEALALPCPTPEKWFALQLEKHWIIRETINTAWGCENAMLADLLQLRLIETPEQVIESYSTIPENCVGSWQAAEVLLPMQLLAEGTVDNNVNILTGEFKVKQDSHLELKKWRVSGIAAGVLLLLVLLNLFFQSRQVEQQTLLLKSQVESVYQQAFPGQGKLQYNRIKKKIKSLSGGLSQTDGNAGLLVMLNELSPVIVGIPSFKILTLKFDAKKQEIRFTASADSFQAFEQLAAKMPAGYQLEQGALSNSKNRVSGALTVRIK